MRMQQLGIAEVPAQVVRSMEKVQLAGPLMTEAVLSGGWAPPQLMLEGAVLSSDGGLGQGPGLAAGTAVALAGSVAGVGAAAGTMTPKAMRVRMGRTRRPKSAGPTPRGTRGVAQSNGGSYSAGGRGSYSNGGRGYQSAGGRGSYQSVMASPRVTSAGGKGGRLGGYARPASAGAGADSCETLRLLKPLGLEGMPTCVSLSVSVFVRCRGGHVSTQADAVKSNNG
ncbi:hypothetical protein Vretifemale_378 [Volvox reticuliferus]|uniref:Uncharacterized protein n=1 Tax=Volvox reticuliferus TaxID=1737510 RepID=A0A8J4BVM0_9CHLO|nr:hypothetical protein Vretifemale_378 [Volvox reticuliferus]